MKATPTLKQLLDTMPDQSDSYKLGVLQGMIDFALRHNPTQTVKDMVNEQIAYMLRVEAEKNQ